VQAPEVSARVDRVAEASEIPVWARDILKRRHAGVRQGERSSADGGGGVVRRRSTAAEGGLGGSNSGGQLKIFSCGHCGQWLGARDRISSNLRQCVI
jgi:hypothetical protein